MGPKNGLTVVQESLEVGTMLKPGIKRWRWEKTRAAVQSIQV